MVMNNKHIFWQALVVTILIFFIGMIFGFFMEGLRSDKVDISLIDSEINLLDQQMRNDVIQNFNITCRDATNSTFIFADKIYYDAQRLEKYEESSKFTSTLLLFHKRYDLLRLMLWGEANQIKKKCGDDFHVVVYLYEYNVEEVDKDSRQMFVSNLLLELREKHPNEILLIPIATNLGLESVNLAIDKFNIEEYPAVIIDDKKVVEEFNSIEELEKEVF